MRLLGASFKKTAEKSTANAYATERKWLNSGSKRTFGPFMHGFHMIGFQRKGALFVLYPDELLDRINVYAETNTAIVKKTSVPRRLPPMN